MNSQGLKQANLPDSPGVYFFLSPKREILYIGKATSLKDRVKSYFSKDLMKTRGPLLVKMVEEAESLAYKTTDSVLEALMLEAFEIKKHKPDYNSKEKDDKSYNYVAITKEEFPRLLIVRGRNMLSDKNKEYGIKNKENSIHYSSFTIQNSFGPFPKATELKEALKIIRKIFPYRDAKCTMKRPCFNSQIGLCPACTGQMTKQEYKKRIKHITLFFEGNKGELVESLEKEMNSLAEAKRFEVAAEIKKKLYALEHIQDMALIKRDVERGEGGVSTRIEAYDIAHLSGKDVVGVMTVVEDGERAPSQYRKFKIKIDKNDDVGNLREILMRRLNHDEWSKPDIVVVDGGQAQINLAKKIWKGVEVVAVTKDERHKARELVGKKEIINKWSASILLANSEAHRFAIGYHRKLRNRGFRI